MKVKFPCCMASSLHQICQVVIATDGSAGENYTGSEYKLFTEKGYFTIKCLDLFWDGNFTDYTTEQFQVQKLNIEG